AQGRPGRAGTRRRRGERGDECPRPPAAQPPANPPPPAAAGRPAGPATPTLARPETRLHAWTCWQRTYAPAAGPPTSTPRLAGSRPWSCKTHTTARNAATFSPHPTAPPAPGGTGSPVPSQSPPSTPPPHPPTPPPRP